MQKSILAGFAIGFGALALACLIDSHWHFASLLAFFNFTAMLIIFGGIAGAIVVSMPPEHLREFRVALQKAFLDYKDIDMAQMASDLMDMSLKARQEGLLSLEGKLPEVQDPWLRRGMQLVVDGLDAKLIKDIMEIELEEYNKRIKIGAEMFQQLGGFAPTLGIIGTVMGLVHMLANMEDMANIGRMISVAFLATFWGILSANLIFLPICNRVKIKDGELMNCRTAMVEAILSMQAGESSRILEEKLKLFMSHDDLKRYEELRPAPGR